MEPHDIDESQVPKRWSKRQRGSPTGITPRQAQKRTPIQELKGAQSPLHSRRELQFGKSVQGKTRSWMEELDQWTLEELYALVEFVLLRSGADKWTSSHRKRVWQEASDFVAERTKSDTRRTGGLHSDIFLVVAL